VSLNPDAMWPLSKDPGAMRVIVLNSGSNGNAVFVESVESGHALLFDCGISRKQIELRLQAHKRSLSNVLGIFLTHEHGDHVRGLPTLTKLHRIPTYLTEGTYQGLRKYRSDTEFHIISNNDSVDIGEFTVFSRPKSHDARDPVYFELLSGNKRFVYATDLGVAGNDFPDSLRMADAVMLESNYDEEMLNNGPYPEYLKARIRSGKGHLSNKQSMDLLRDHCNGRLSMLIFAHLSENNNRPELVQRELDTLLQLRPEFRPRVHIASRRTVSEVFTV